MDLDDLKSLLALRGVDFSMWGISSHSRPVESLFEELRNDESSLIVHASQLLREVPVVYVSVYYRDTVLIEDRVEWKDGRSAERRALRESIACKRSFGEDPKLAGMRIIKDQLGIAVAPSRLCYQHAQQEAPEDCSKSFPGLMTRLIETYFYVKLHSDEWNPDGYRKERKDRTVFFVWKPIKET